MDDMYDSYLKHSDEHGESDTTLDRIDVNGNYELSNCRWATRQLQTRNMRPRSSNKSGVTGVRELSEDKWEASLKVDGIKHIIGNLSTFEEACSARKELEEKFWNETNNSEAI